MTADTFPCPMTQSLLMYLYITVKPLPSGHSLLSRHLGRSQRCPLNTSFTRSSFLCTVNTDWISYQWKPNRNGMWLTQMMSCDVYIMTSFKSLSHQFSIFEGMGGWKPCHLMHDYGIFRHCMTSSLTLNS